MIDILCFTDLSWLIWFHLTKCPIPGHSTSCQSSLWCWTLSLSGLWRWHSEHHQWRERMIEDRERLLSVPQWLTCPWSLNRASPFLQDRWTCSDLAERRLWGSDWAEKFRLTAISQLQSGDWLLTASYPGTLRHSQVRCRGCHTSRRDSISHFFCP